MALVDADYKFIFIDVGCNGRVSDGGVFKNSSLSKALERKQVKLPQTRHTDIPYVKVADDAFALKPYLMKP